MRSTKACDAGALIRSCAKGASREYTGIRCSQNYNGSDAQLETPITRSLNASHMQAKTIGTFHNFSS